MNPTFLEALQKILEKEQYKVNEPMSSHITFRVGGNADCYVNPSVAQLPQIIALCRQFEIPWMIIGNGSNLLVGDKGIRGVVIEMGKYAAKVDVTGDRVTAEAGAMLAAVAKQAARAGLSGMEFASGIPGTIGGAVVMNAGAYGGEMKDIITAVTVLTRAGEQKKLSLEELELSYRHSCIPENEYIVLQAELKLFPEEKEKIEARMEELKIQRVTKQPLEYPSAGSTFKRPEGYFAGKLIQDAGLRGFQVGGAQVSEKHCGFVINKEHATALDIDNLIKEVQDRVEQKFGIRLETEVKYIGEF